MTVFMAGVDNLKVKFANRKSQQNVEMSTIRFIVNVVRIFSYTLADILEKKVLQVLFWMFSNHDTLKRWCFNAGPTSAMLAQH